MDESTEERRRHFSIWLRTGRLPGVRNANGVAFKFNPWHDPDNGRFTFAGTGRYFGGGIIVRPGVLHAPGAARNPFAVATEALVAAARTAHGIGLHQVQGGGRLVARSVSLLTNWVLRARAPSAHRSGAKQLATSMMRSRTGGASCGTDMSIRSMPVVAPGISLVR